MSVIIPVKNEAQYIRKTVESLLESTDIEVEIFICNTGSTDATPSIISALEHTFKQVKIKNTPNKNVAQVFNEIFPVTVGKYIALFGAHALYNPSYLAIAVDHLERNECDVAGGPLAQEGHGAKGKAIAAAMSCKFGVGRSRFRTETEKRFVKTVPFAVYRKDIFTQTGLMNEQLIRNQDDEMHYRIHEKGFRILMIPEMRATYFVRETYSDLFKQYFQYGYYKPLVLKNVSSGADLGHFVPSAFVIYLILCFVFFKSFIGFIPLLVYALLAVYFSMRTNNIITVRLRSIPAFFIIHISYGTGFLLGILKIIFK